MGESTGAKSSGAHAQGAPVKVGLFSLWAIGVGSFIGGNFIGWPSVLIGGFGSALISVGFFGVYFLMLGNATGELSARFRDSGGTYMYSKRIFGERVGVFAGMMHVVKLIGGNCCMVIAISGYLAEITTDSDLVHILSWVGCYCLFTAIHCCGGYSSIYFQNGIVVMCLIVVLLYFFAASRSFDFKENALGERGWFEGGINGFLLGFPYGIWFLDGFEELPLAIELSSDLAETIPMALNMCAVTAISLALGLIFLGASSTDPVVLMEDPAPLMMSFVGVWGNNWVLVFLLDIAILLGLAICFSSFVLFSGRMVQAVAEDGLLPKPLAAMSPRFGTPVNATVFSSLAGLVITTTFGLLFGIDKAEDALIACSLLSSVTCYIMNFCCLHVVLKTEEDVAALRLGDGAPLACPYGGEDPGKMRFKLGRRGVELSIALSIFVMGCIFYIFVVQESYHLGILIMSSVMCVAWLLVYLYTCVTTERRVHEELSDMSTRSTSTDISTRSTTPMVKP